MSLSIAFQSDIPFQDIEFGIKNHKNVTMQVNQVFVVAIHHGRNEMIEPPYI